ncbi:hypothetical protein ACS0TY_001241 [Phlomoides rotata]
MVKGSVRRKKRVTDSEDETHNTGRRKPTRGERERTHTHEISKKNKSVGQSKKIVEDKRRKGNENDGLFERERTHTHEISKKNKSVGQSKKIVEDKRRKGKMVVEESDTSLESDSPIVLKKRRRRYVNINSSEGEGEFDL